MYAMSDVAGEMFHPVLRVNMHETSDGAGETSR